MARGNGYKATLLIIALMGMSLTLAGLIWAAAVQNERLDVGVKTIEAVREKADISEKDIISIKSDLKYIKEGIDNINRKLDK
jgi:hypothetical protein